MKFTCWVAPRDETYSINNFYMDSGRHKNPPQHKPRGIYTIEYHVSRIVDNKFREKTNALIGVFLKQKEIIIQISKKRISFKRDYVFYYFLIRRNFIIIMVKNSKGWEEIRIDDRHNQKITSQLKIFNDAIIYGDKCLFDKVT